MSELVSQNIFSFLTPWFGDLLVCVCVPLSLFSTSFELCSRCPRSSFSRVQHDHPTVPLKNSKFETEQNLKVSENFICEKNDQQVVCCPPYQIKLHDKFLAFVCLYLIYCKFVYSNLCFHRASETTDRFCEFAVVSTMIHQP